MSTTLLVHRAGDEALAAAPLVKRRKPGQWIGAVVVLWLAVEVIRSVATNQNLKWDHIWHYFVRGNVLDGLWLTIWLTALTYTVAFVLGIVLAAMRLSPNPVLASVSFVYTWFFRSLPPLLLLLLLYNIAALYPETRLGIPYLTTWTSLDNATLFTPILAAIVGLILNEAAFAGEIIRGGLLSVDAGQREAARSLGLSEGWIFRRIVLPQAMPAILPPSGNMLIGLLKATSIVSVIGVDDLLHKTQLIYSQNFEVIPLLVVATIWYLILTTVLSIGQYFLERHYGRGRSGAAARNFAQIFRDTLPLFPGRRQSRAVTA